MTPFSTISVVRGGRNVGCMPRKQTPGIICLEGEWSSKLTDTSTVHPILELLAHQQQIKFIHKDVGTLDELDHYLNKWLQKQYAEYNIGYLAFHGDPGGIWLGRKRVDLETITEIIDRRGSGRILHFGSCSTLDIPPRHIKQFLADTKVKAVCGYREDVGWLESAAFEVLLVEALTYYRRVDAAYNYLRKNYSNLCRRLQFKMVW